MGKNDCRDHGGRCGRPDWVAGVMVMRNTKFGLVSSTEARCLGELERELKDGQWVPRRVKRKPKPYRPVITVWGKNDEDKVYRESTRVVRR